jgi:GNAT superfamily N-acetyltransferase
MDISLSLAEIENAAEIALLTQELGYSATEIQTAEWLTYMLTSNIHSVFIASNERAELCGWVVVEKRISLEAGFKAEITGLVVGEKFRRFGVGKQLVIAAEAWARELNLGRLVVRSNIQRNDSHSFYKNIGFAFKKSAHNYEKLL